MYHFMSVVKDLAARARTDCKIKKCQKRCLLVAIRSKLSWRGGLVEVGPELNNIEQIIATGRLNDADGERLVSWLLRRQAVKVHWLDEMYIVVL